MWFRITDTDRVKSFCDRPYRNMPIQFVTETCPISRSLFGNDSMKDLPESQKTFNSSSESRIGKTNIQYRRFQGVFSRPGAPSRYRALRASTPIQPSNTTTRVQQRIPPKTFERPLHVYGV